MFKRKYLLFILALAPLLFLVAPETASAQSTETQTHEGCDFGYVFDYSATLDELEWGSVVRCPLGTYYIKTDAYLFERSSSGQLTPMDVTQSICYVSRSCSAIETEPSPDAGGYHIIYCFGAESVGSSWPYKCLGASESIP